MALPWALVDKVAWATGNVVEDMQLGIDFTLAGYPPVFVPDAIVTAHILRKQLELRPLERLIQITTEPGFLYWCPGQKHKGKTYKEVAIGDPGYLDWIVTKSDMGEAEKFTARHWLQKVAA